MNATKIFKTGDGKCPDSPLTGDRRVKPITVVIFILALSFLITGCLAAVGDRPVYPIHPVACPNASYTASPTVLPCILPDSAHVPVSPGKSVMGIALKEDEISTLSPEAKEWFIQGLYYSNHYNQFDEALECLNRSLEIDPAFTEAWYVKGVALHNLQRFDEAQYCFNRAIVLEPFNISVWFLKSATLIDMIRG